MNDPPGDDPWISALGVNESGILVKEAITENVDLDAFDALEHRFYFVDGADFPDAVSGDGPEDMDPSTLAVYVGAVLHACRGEDVGSEISEESCELYLARGLDAAEIENLNAEDADGYAEVMSVPADIRESVGNPLGRFPVCNPVDLDGLDYSDFLTAAAFGLPGYGSDPGDREPRGFH